MKHEPLSSTRMCAAAVFSAMICVCSFIAVPNPSGGAMFTLQTFAVILAGLMLAPVDALLSGVIYGLLGAVGLPVFSGGATIYTRLFSPYGGYVIGLILAPFFVSLVKTLFLIPLRNSELKPAGKTTVRLIIYIFTAVIVGIIIVDAPGVIQLKLMTNSEWSHAFFAGAVVFMPTDAAKAVLAAIVAVALERPVRSFYI